MEGAMGAVIPLAASGRCGEERGRLAMGARQPCQGCLDTSAARPMSRGRGSGLPTWMPQATSRRVEPGEWPERQPGGDPGQPRFDGAGTREVEEEPGRVVLALRPRV